MKEISYFFSNDLNLDVVIESCVVGAYLIFTNVFSSFLSQGHYYVTMLPCYHVTMLPCYHVTMLPGYYVT